MVLSDVPLSTPLSGKHIYFLELNQTSNQKCKTEICRKSLVYNWHAPYGCQAAFYCTALTGNICGDYGIEMVKGSDKDYICHPGQHYNVTLNLTDSLTINFWYTEDNLNFDVACYFWCLEPLFPQSNFTSVRKSYFQSLSFNLTWTVCFRSNHWKLVNMQSLLILQPVQLSLNWKITQLTRSLNNPMKFAMVTYAQCMPIMFGWVQVNVN